MKKKATILLFGLLIVFILMISSSEEPVFRNPLDIPIELSANFGEIRANHFHTGYDIRTNGKTDYKVYAAADGYISRIKVSATGFGRVLYITHPNGYMTVYGHLDQFSEALTKYVTAQQYEKQSFEIELFPDPGMFPVRKGEVIALSGNSGSSGGPHLHFEIRDASGETFPINPSKFLPIADHSAPKFKGLFLYPLTKCCELQKAFGYSVDGSGKFYKLKIDTVVTDFNTVAFGAEIQDFADNSSFDYGVYSLQALVDDKEIFSLKMDRLVFANGRYVNAHIDYEYNLHDQIIIQRFFRLAGDQNTIYENLVNDGKIDLTDNQYHHVKLIAKDAAGNASQLSFVLKCTVKNYVDSSLPRDAQDIFKYDQPNAFSADGIKLELPEHVLYDDLYFYYSSIPVSDSKYFSPIHQVHNPFTPVHSKYKISIKPSAIPVALRSKAVIAYENQDGKRSTKTSKWEGEFLTAQASEFGSFYVLIDTAAPKISTTFQQNQTITVSKINFKATDDLSGIVSYKAILDGKWLLMEYDPKNDLMTCILNNQVSSGEHTLQVYASDDADNQSVFALKFKRP